MIIITCQDDTQYGFDFEIHADAMRISKTGKVKFQPHKDVRATLEFPSPAVSVEERQA